MTSERKPRHRHAAPAAPDTGLGEPYGHLVTGISGLVDEARRVVVRTANSVIVSTYWEIGRRIVEFEQGGKLRADYGRELLVRLAGDLTARHGRGFSVQGLYKMRYFFLEWQILPTVSGEFQELAEKQLTSKKWPLSWSHYVRLMAVANRAARVRYEAEAIRSGWSVRQLDRQISTQFFERVSASAEPERMLEKARTTRRSILKSCSTTSATRTSWNSST